MPRKIRWILVPFLLALYGGLTYSHGDKKHDDADNDAANVVVDSTQMSADEQTKLKLFQLTLDSTYAQIGASYFMVEKMLRNSCYDCHSAETSYPWYYKIPGIKGFMQGHIDEALEHLDMTYGFPFGGHASQLAQLKEIRKEVEEGEMPIFSYRIMHWGKLIEGDDQKTLFAWIDGGAKAITDVYNAYGMPLPKDAGSDHDDGDEDDGDGDGDNHDDDD